MLSGTYNPLSDANPFSMALDAGTPVSPPRVLLYKISIGVSAFPMLVNHRSF